MTSIEIAKKSTEAMWERDRASKGVGLKIERVAPGEADLSLLVDDKHLNGHDICHGGFIFTLADSAFAFACNSYNEAAVAQNNSISYILPAYKGKNFWQRQERSVVREDPGFMMLLFLTIKKKR